jgi:hypothetical protein
LGWTKLAPGQRSPSVVAPPAPLPARATTVHALPSFGVVAESSWLVRAWAKRQICTLLTFVG